MYILCVNCNKEYNIKGIRRVNISRSNYLIWVLDVWIHLSVSIFSGLNKFGVQILTIVNVDFLQRFNYFVTIPKELI